MIRFAITLFLAATLHGAEPLRVLFIGNSYTYFNNSPEIFAELARASAPGREVVTKMIAIPGATLISLWEGQTALQTIRSPKWDYVVLQDQSQLGDGLRDGKFVVNSPILLNWGVKLFDAEIRKAGARTVVLLNWSRRDEPDQQADLTYAYDSVARDVGAILAPVGIAWQKVRQENPAIALYAADGSHPSPAGSYLIACVLVGSLNQNSVVADMPASVSGHSVSDAGEVDMARRAPLVSLPPEAAREIRTIAKSVVDELRRSGGTLNAPKPERRTKAPPGGGSTTPQAIAGAWTGNLTYYPSPAFLNLTLQFNGNTCEGQVAIHIPECKQRYEAPAFNCAVSAGHLSFSVTTLPLPFLFDRFVGMLVGDRLVGTVERQGRELTNSMSGFWNLGREAARN
jgi:hypothetical protein